MQRQMKGKRPTTIAEYIESAPSQGHPHLRGLNLRLRPSNRLEALVRDRAGQWSIRVNDQWRICFRFDNGDAYDVEIVDYH